MANQSRVWALRLLTWCCVILLAVLSLLPAQEMVRTDLPGQFEHFIAYAGSAAIAMAGYGLSRGGMRIIGGFWPTQVFWSTSSISGYSVMLIVSLDRISVRAAYSAAAPCRRTSHPVATQSG